MGLRVGLFIGLALMLAACGGDDGEQPAVPTVITVVPRAVPTLIGTSDAAGAETTAEVASAPTGLPETWTPTATSTNDPTITVTPSSTITNTPSWTPTATATLTLEPNALNSLVDIMLQFTPLPTEFNVAPGGGLTPTPTPTTFQFPATAAATLPGVVTATGTTTTACNVVAPGEFGTVLATNPNLAAQIGCAVGSPPQSTTVTSAAQRFEGGAMLWVDGVPGTIYVMYNGGSYQTFADTYDPSLDPESGPDQPPSGLFQPIRGFGKVWREQPGVRDQLGWAIAGEAGGSASIQDFASGRMIAAQPRGDMLALVYTSLTWQSLPRATTP